MPQPTIPTYKDLLWPTLKVLETNGGSASIEELSESVAKFLNLNDKILDALHNDGPRTEVDYRAAWARTHLKLIAAVENSDRGVWSITEKGQRIKSENEVKELIRLAHQERHRLRNAKKSISQPIDEDEGSLETLGILTWEEILLDALRSMKPDAFERLCQRLLREAGFTKVEVTGRSGDGGIDGAGVLRVNLLSFHVRFQCKKYSGSVGASEIRDFRGAMVGRADKGLFITTGRFTKDAEREAVRDGAPAIDLIDGTELCRLLKSLKLGVVTVQTETVNIQNDFFKSF